MNNSEIIVYFITIYLKKNMNGVVKQVKISIHNVNFTWSWYTISSFSASIILWNRASLLWYRRSVLWIVHKHEQWIHNEESTKGPATTLPAVIYRRGTYYYGLFFIGLPNIKERIDLPVSVTVGRGTTGHAGLPDQSYFRVDADVHCFQAVQRGIFIAIVGTEAAVVPTDSRRITAKKWWNLRPPPAIAPLSAL